MASPYLPLTCPGLSLSDTSPALAGNDNCDCSMRSRAAHTYTEPPHGFTHAESQITEVLMGNRFSAAVLQRLGSCFSSRLLSLATVAAVLVPAGASAITLPDTYYSVNLHQSAGPFNASYCCSAPGTYTLGLQAATITGSPDGLGSAHSEGANGIGTAPGS